LHNKVIPIPEEIADRKQALDIKINLSRHSSANGSIDHGRLSAASRIATSSRHSTCTIIQEGGQLEMAARAMKRRKIMQE
jgi:hypothetical protein